MFLLEVSHLQALTTFSLPDALPNFGDPIVFTVAEYILAKVSRKVYDYKELLQTVFKH